MLRNNFDFPLNIFLLIILTMCTFLLETLQVLRKNALGCDLATCRQQCYQQLHGDGQCVAAPGGGLNPPYKCVCFYNC
uniref:Uncharacterized protein n=1 Tax=Kalanchoe fedtschenkoi TaxID=63787 RepID=A0A7N0RFM3_KALFE